MSLNGKNTKWGKKIKHFRSIGFYGVITYTNISFFDDLVFQEKDQLYWKNNTNSFLLLNFLALFIWSYKNEAIKHISIIKFEYFNSHSPSCTEPGDH